MTLGEKLRADQDVALAAPHFLERLPKRRALARDVAIDPDNTRPGEKPRDRFFNPLRAAARRPQIGVAASRAVAGHRVLRTAVMAAQAPVGGMQHESRGAARAAGRPSARIA